MATPNLRDTPVRLRLWKVTGRDNEDNKWGPTYIVCEDDHQARLTAKQLWYSDLKEDRPEADLGTWTLQYMESVIAHDWIDGFYGEALAAIVRDRPVHT